MNRNSIVMAGMLILSAVACQTDESQVPISTEVLPNDFYVPDALNSGARSAASISITTDYLDAINDALSSKGANYRVAMAELITAAGSNEAGQTVIAKNVGNKQLPADFVPGDVRRTWSSNGGNEITYAIDQTADAVPPMGGLSAAATTAAIEAGTNTWRDVRCSDLGLSRNNDFGIDLGYIAALFGLGGSLFVAGDVMNTGFTDIDFFGGVLGATFTFIWIDGSGNPTDIDNNGRDDVAFREIYYDPSWEWADTGNSADGIDLESVAVHEIGHGLSQAHFGTVAIKKKGYLKASPRAVMNALYTGTYRDLVGTDNGGHCSLWADWPNN